jgi:hypothetical protein
MAFFGLSALGPQSSLATGRIEGDTYTVSLFSLEEFREAFEMTLEKTGGSILPITRIPDVLCRIFHGPAPPLEAKRVSEAVAARADSTGSVGVEVFLKIVAELQAAPVAVDIDRHA